MTNLVIGYTITTDPNFLNKQNAITPELLGELEQYYHLAQEGKKSSIQKILDAIERYPDNPQLKNYLSVLYGRMEEDQKMYDTNKWIITEHPNYLFGKLNLANEYYLRQEYDKIPDVLGHEMEIKVLYPDRDTFHITEVISFLKCVILYFTAIGDIDQAKTRHEIMNKLAPDSSDTEFAGQQIYAAIMKAGQKRFEEEEKSRISVKVKSQQYKNITKAPNFCHPEIEWLYSNGLYIQEEKLNTILSLPTYTLVNDLELVLQDSIDRYGYFSKLCIENEWDEEKMNFVIHSLYLLGELQSTKSIHAVFNVLSQSEEYLELYIGDFMTELMWEVGYKIAGNNLEDCIQFLFKPGIETFARVIFPEMVMQLVLHNPERRDEALNWYNDLIQFFLKSSLEDNVIDSDLIGFIICYLIDINGIELLSEIKKLFDHGIVTKGICGDWDSVSKSFTQPDNYNNKRDIRNIKERYKEITTTWAGYSKEENSRVYDYTNKVETSPKPIKAKSKIGRNSPCPCGSGKKYKKCCLIK